jgi:ferritin-like metal-binding protein YciE
MLEEAMASKMQTLEDLYEDLLKDLYSAEKQLVKALPKMAKNAESPDLQKAFEEHLDQTEQHVERIERIFSDLGSSPRGKKCVGMEGLIEEGDELLKEDVDPDVLDAGLIAAAQKVEHYEMAGYGTARAWAQKMGYHDAANLLQQTLEEESMANEKLTELAESHINMEAK